MPYLVKFVNIGRSKASWEIRCEQPPSDEVLEEEVRRRRVLMSQDIIVDTIDQGRARVYAGIRSVGEIAWEEVLG